ncbi:hypothetical protein D5S17_12925 [Pseudonocardiaceae bacterium YIM PH 21723]|nr:hypothetical protein D5S17_12925 [Pseudonocardiaceae bacterium YIM PH 21723]
MKLARTHPGVWPAAAAGAGILLAFVYFSSIWVGGLDIAETCELRGESWDGIYHNQHERDGLLVHQWCNQHYDLMPVWVNPALVILWVLAGFSVLMVLYTALVRARDFEEDPEL